MLPTVFGESLFDEFFDDAFMRPMRAARDGFFAPHTSTLMKTDVKETDTSYEVDIDLPGFKKEDVKVDLKDGCLTVSAATNSESSDKDENGKYLRRERFAGSCSRTFYVGEMEPSEISAKFEDGILKLALPRKEEQKKLPPSTNIAIE